MFIKGSILALLIASVYAGEIADTNPSPDNSDYNDGDKTVSYPSRRRNGGGKPTPVSGSAWGSGRVRARAGRNPARAGRIRAKAARRRRWGRPANWVRPNRPANNDWVKPSSESESWDTAPDSESWDKPAEPEWVSPSWDGDTHEPTSSPTETPTEGDYQVCDKTNRNICCDLGSAMSETTKRGVCKALGCEYDKCQWRDDGYGGGGGGYSEEVSSAKYYTGGYNGGGGGYSGSAGGYSGSGGGSGGGYGDGGYNNNGGSNTGGYSGGGYSSIKEYKTVVVKEDRADKYTGVEPIEEYQEEEPIEEYKEEEEEEEEEEVEVGEVVKYDYKQPSQPSWISSKVEVDPEPTEESYETACDDDAKIFCCTQKTGTLQERISICDQMSCAWQKCGWGKRSGWEDDGHEPTQTPTSWEDDSHDQCDVFARNICCTQHDDLTVGEKKEVCDDLGCIYEKCGWKKDGYDDDESESSWKNDGYSQDYDDDKYADYFNNNYQKNKYNVKDYYNNNDQTNKYNVKDYNDNNYQQNKYDFQDYNENNYQKNKYNFKNDDDDECTADEREECCTANEKKQFQVCQDLGCNIRKCDKKEGGWDDNYDQKDNYDVKDDYDDDKCTADEREECCTANEKKQFQVCQDLGCNIRKCDKKDGGWDDNYDQKDNYDVKDDYDNDNKCTADEREECCTANEKKQLQVCEDLGCNIRKCDKKEGGYGGWDDKDDAQYEVLYKPADENDVKNNYDQKDNYDFKDDYDDDECTAGEREECCTANEKKQWQICTMLGCNPKKCDKKDWGDYDNQKDKYKSDEYETNPQYEVLYKPDDSYKPAYGDPAPRYEVFPKYSDGIEKPTARPTYRAYASSSSSNGYNPTLPTMRPTYRAYASSNNNANDGYSTNNGYIRPTMRPTYRAYSTNHDVNNNAYPDPNMPDPNAYVYPNPIPNDAYPRQYVGGGYGN